MAPSRGFFESESDYQARVARESDERTIEEATGRSPSRGFFESDGDYRERIRLEAAERVIERHSGSRPDRGFFESDLGYRDRMAREANERIVESATGSRPDIGWFESSDDYAVRVRREANEHALRSYGVEPSQGWFEGNHDYRSRIALEAQERNVDRPRARPVADNSRSAPPALAGSPSVAASPSWSTGPSTYGGSSMGVHGVHSSAANARVSGSLPSSRPVQRPRHVGFEENPSPLVLIIASAFAGAMLPFAAVLFALVTSALLKLAVAVAGVLVLVAFALIGLRAGLIGLFVGAGLGYFFGFSMLPMVSQSVSQWLSALQAAIVARAESYFLGFGLAGAGAAAIWSGKDLASSLASPGIRGRDLPIRLRWIALAAAILWFLLRR